jgi:hypothetical protein
MVREKVKSEILDLLDQIPDQHISMILTYMQDLLQLIAIDKEAARHLSEIMKEDDNLLKRLAE